MTMFFLTHKLSDLSLGKPPLRSLSESATVADGVTMLKNSYGRSVSVWSCNHSRRIENEEVVWCQCVGKLCMVDVICYLCKEENLLSPSTALKTPICDILPKVPGLVVHLEPSSSLLEAIDLFIQGAQNLVVPILQTKKQEETTTINSHNSVKFCWLTQEHVMRFLLDSISLFTPLPSYSIHDLQIINSDVLSIDYYSPATSALEAISKSLTQQTSVAIINSDGTFIGEISPFTLASCDATVAAAITTLSVGQLMAYIDCGGHSKYLMNVVKGKLKERNLEKMLEEFTVSSSLRKYVRKVEDIVCSPKSSVAAVMYRVVSERANYVWVVEDDGSLVGIVTSSNIFRVFREHSLRS